MPDDVANGNTAEEGKKNNNARNRNHGTGSNRGRGGNNNASGRRPNAGRQGQNARPQSTKVDMKKYERMITAAHTNFSDIPCGKNSADCDICCKPNDVFGIGACRHPICVECAIRMRVLGNSKTCPVCRADIETLSFCTLDDDLSTVPLSFQATAHPDETRFGIRFSNPAAGSKYEKYLAHVCKICKTDDGERLEFPSFMSLRQHMASRHEQSYCHICTDNLNLFSRERKTYTRDQLQRHMKSGDFDDKSFKGHPQCLFCEQKFLDEENRYRHLRKEHFFCQFCESDGTMTNVFFGKHDELKKHYKDHHFICESEECKQMGIAFANKFELDLHRANEHAEKRNLIDLGFVQRSNGAADTSRPPVSFRGGRGGGRNNDPPAVPRERIAIVQRQVETNPQSDPSQFTTVRSAQSKGVFTSTRSAFTSSNQDFPSLGPQAPPPSIRSSEFPRLNKVNKSAPAAPAAVVDHFPSLGAGSSSSSAPPLRIKVPPLAKKRQPPPAPAPQKTVKPTSSRQYRDDEEDDFVSRKDVPQAVIKVNNSLLRFDTVDDRVSQPAKSNIQMIQRTEQKPASSSSSAAPAGKFDFPALPAASAPMAPANTNWLNSKNSRIKSAGAISSVTVPANYSKATQNLNKKKNKVSVPKTEVWSSLGPAPDASVTSPTTDEWQSIPLSKEAQADLEKKQRKEEWARKKAEIQARVAAASDSEKKEGEEEWAQRKAEIQAKIAAASREMKNSEESESDSVTPITTPIPSKAEPDWQVATSKAGEAAKAAEIAANNKKNKKNKKKTEQAATLAEKNTTEKKTELSPPVKKNEPVKKAEPVKKTEPVAPKPAPATAPKVCEVPVVPAEPVKDSYQEKMDALWNMPKLPSIPSMFSSFSLSSVFGMGSSSNAPTPTSGPPPGLENVVLTPPPGLGFPKPPAEQISFDSAPLLSHDDVKEKRDRIETQRQKKQQEETEKEDDGWTTTGKAKGANGKKNKKK